MSSFSATASAPIARSSHLRIYAAVGLGLAAAVLGSLLLGYRTYSPLQLWAAFAQFDNSEAHIVIRDYRLPRALLAPICGAALGVAGTLMQTLARNGIASPDTLGLNAGAALSV